MRGLTLLYVVCLLIFLSSSLHGQDTRQFASQRDTINFNRFLLDNLSLLYREFETEYILCLEGEFKGRSLYVDDFRFPHHVESTERRAKVDPGCQASYEGIVATLHNHTPANGMCYLSGTDMREFLGTPYVVIFVQCDRYKIAWWHRSHVRRYKLLDRHPPYYVPHARIFNFKPEED